MDKTTSLLDRMRLEARMYLAKGVKPPQQNYLPNMTLHPISGWNAAGVTPTNAVNPAQQELFYDYQYSPEYTVGHEMDHVLKNRAGYGSTHPIEDMLAKASAGGYVLKDVEFRKKLKALIEKRKEDIFNKYPSARGAEPFNRPHEAPMTELMAEMNAIEDKYRVDLRKDEIFKELFSDPVFNEAYNASTGYRRTRYDKNDLPPYQMREEGFWSRLRNALK